MSAPWIPPPPTHARRPWPAPPWPIDPPRRPSLASVTLRALCFAAALFVMLCLPEVMLP